MIESMIKLINGDNNSYIYPQKYPNYLEINFNLNVNLNTKIKKIILMITTITFQIYIDWYKKYRFTRLLCSSQMKQMNWLTIRVQILWLLFVH